MGDEFNVEELLAEEEEVGFSQRIILTGIGIISAYGWFLLAAGIGFYYLWRNYSDKNGTATASTPHSAKEIAAFQNKEEARQKYVAKLQEKYEQEAAVRAEKTKQKEEEKRKIRLAELEKMTGSGGGHTLGTNESGPSTSGNQPRKRGEKPKSSSLRPEYNPLMGDTTRSSRPCTSSGRSGG